VWQVLGGRPAPMLNWRIGSDDERGG
jgi:hypothetical protein